MLPHEDLVDVVFLPAFGVQKLLWPRNPFQTVSWTLIELYDLFVVLQRCLLGPSFTYQARSQNQAQRNYQEFRMKQFKQYETTISVELGVETYPCGANLGWEFSGFYKNSAVEVSNGSGGAKADS